MAKNKICDLRDHLFETLEALKDKESPLDLDRAKAICNVAQTVINSAKVEVDYLRIAGEMLGQTMDIKTEFFAGHAPAVAGKAALPALPPASRSNGNGKR
jgi:hypothetical protein